VGAGTTNLGRLIGALHGVLSRWWAFAPRNVLSSTRQVHVGNDIDAGRPVPGPCRNGRIALRLAFRLALRLALRLASRLVLWVAFRLAPGLAPLLAFTGVTGTRRVRRCRSRQSPPTSGKPESIAQARPCGQTPTRLRPRDKARPTPARPPLARP
jgi:hypothetical protein